MAKKRRKPGMMGFNSVFTFRNIVIGVVIILAVMSFLSLFLDSYVFVIVATVVCVVLLLLVLFLINFWKQKQARKKFENAKIDRMLSKPLVTFGENEDEASKLAKLYEDKIQ